MDYLKIENRKGLDKHTVRELDELMARLRLPHAPGVQRNLEPKTVKINALLRYFRRQFDHGDLLLAVPERKAKPEPKAQASA
jgi:hypothetical protein